MSEPEPSRDPTMNDIYSLAQQLGSPPKLPDSLKDLQAAVTFLDYIDSEKIGDLFYSLKPDEFIVKVGELTREKIPDINDGNTRANIACRLYAGCLDSAKTIRDSYVQWYPGGTKEDRPITPKMREEAWYQLMKPRSKGDALYKFGVELGPALRKIREQRVYLEGIPSDSIVRRYVKAGVAGNVVSPKDITLEA